MDDLLIWYTLIMVAEVSAGSQEIEHTADWELLVWAPDLTALLEQSARGMYRLQAIKLKTGPRYERQFELTIQDPESLLVEFLSELLHFIDTEELVFDEFDLRITGNKLMACMTGAPIKKIAKEIKAVTYHNLRVRQTKRGLETNVVFDV